MSGTGIDPAIEREAIRLADAGQSFGQIADATGLMTKEVRLILDNERQRRANLTPQASRPTGAVVRPAPAPRDELAELLAQADASNVGKVKTAAKRARESVGRLRQILADTEQERREADARAEKERVARAAIEVLTRQLAETKAELAELSPKKGRKRATYNISEAERERRRQQCARMREARAAKRAEAA